MTNDQTALSMMKDLRAILDRGLEELEDYRALKALDKAILEVKIASEVAQEARTRGEYQPHKAPRNPVGDVQTQVVARFIA